MTIPRGIRNHNPGNIERNAINWQGQSNIQDDPRFVRFDHPKYGIRALMKLLLSYFWRHRLDTPRLIINRYAPSHENNTGAYIKAVADALGVLPDGHLDVNNQPTLVKLAKAIVRHENGDPKKCSVVYPKDWYADALYELAASMALGKTGKEP